MIIRARLTFSAAHVLRNPERDDAWNREVFGKDANPAGHGHNYALEVSVRGAIDPETGMVMDLAKLKDIMRQRVIDHVDHNNLNTDVAWLRGVIPTSENLARAFWQQLAPAFDNGRALHEIVLHETERNSVVYRGEDE